MLWLPLRIRAVWRGEKSAPPIPIRKRDRYFLGYHVFDVNDRNFPMFGSMLFSMGGFALFLGAATVLKSMGGSPLTRPLRNVGLAMLILAFLFGLFAQLIFTVGRPKSLIPPGQREETPSSTD